MCSPEKFKLATYCIFNKEDILRFSFDCFDVDGSGKIDKEEVNQLINSR